MVNATRDKPQLPSPEQILEMKGSASVADFLEDRTAQAKEPDQCTGPISGRDDQYARRERAGVLSRGARCADPVGQFLAIVAADQQPCIDKISLGNWMRRKCASHQGCCD